MNMQEQSYKHTYIVINLSHRLYIIFCYTNGLRICENQTFRKYLFPPYTFTPFPHLSRTFLSCHEILHSIVSISLCAKNKPTQLEPRNTNVLFSFSYTGVPRVYLSTPRILYTTGLFWEWLDLDASF